MRSKLFSPLLRGSGPDWSSNFKWYEDQPNKVQYPASSSSSDSSQHSRYVIHDRHLYRTVPKTFATNKGAIVLYTSEDYVLRDRVSQAVYPAPPANEIQSCDLDNLQRNILQFGTTEEDKACLKFTRPSPDDVYLDESTRPGALPEVYLEDLKYKTRLFTKSNKMSAARLRPTERIKTARTQCSSPAPSTLADSLDHTPASRPDSGAEKRKLLRPPSAPPQPMPSVEKRKIEIIRDQLKHLDAAQRREKLKYADFELVSTIPDHFKVKGLGGRGPKRRAYSSPVYKTKYCEDKTYVTSDQTQSLPLFVVTSTPSSRVSGSPGHARGRRGSQEYGGRGSYDAYTCEGGQGSEDSDRLDMSSNLPAGSELEQQSSQTIAKTNIIAADIKPIRRKTETSDQKEPATRTTPLSAVNQVTGGDEKEPEIDGITEQTTEQQSEGADRCPSSRQIIIDLPDENKEKPKDSFISAELRQDMMETQSRSQVEPGEEGDKSGKKGSEKLGEEEATTTTSTIEQKSGEEISSTIEDSLQNLGQNRILTYPSFLSLSSANSKGDPTHDDTAQPESEGSDDPEAKKDALLDAKTLVNEIAKKSRRKRAGGKEKEGDPKKKTIRSAKSKKQQHVPELPAPSTSDGEFKEKQPPKSLVAMHRENIDSSSSIAKKKSTSSGSKKKRLAKSSDRVVWDTEPRSEGANSDNDDVFSKAPQTMLLEDDLDDQVSPGTPRQRKRLERSHRQRPEQSAEKPSTPPPPGPPKTSEFVGPLIKDSTRMSHDFTEEEEDDELAERMRQEEREREQRTLEQLERRIGMADGSLKRLGEKVEIIEKESIQQKDKEAALRQQGIQEELSRKEEERKAYEEVMRAQEAEYERHLQNMLRQEEERNRQYQEQLRKDEIQRDVKRKFAMFRQNQNLELRQHVRLSKLKQKFTIPFKYSYFPILKVNYMEIGANPDQLARKGSGGNIKTMKNKKMTLKRV